MYTQRDTFFRYILLHPTYKPKYIFGCGWYLRPDEIIYIGNRPLPGTTTLQMLVKKLHDNNR